MRELLNDLLIHESNEDPESELAGDLESCSSDGVAGAQVSQPPDIEDSAASQALHHRLTPSSRARRPPWVTASKESKKVDPKFRG